MAFSKIIFLSITIVFIFVFVTCSGAEEEKGGGEKATEKYFKNISRLQYRKSINGGENAITQGTFLILPYGFTFAELLELSTGINEKNATNFSNFDLEMKLSRYMIPSEDWGRTFSWVARFQSASGVAGTFGIGLQWNISETPGINRTTKDIPWKSLLQIFAKDRDQFGTVDIYHWYQFPILKNNRLYVRGTNVYYILPGKNDFFSAMQDVIMPVSENFDLFLRHSYQNIEGFLNHSKGSQFALGVRVAI